MTADVWSRLMTAAGGVGSGARHRTRHRSRRLVGLGVADVLLLSLIVVAAAVVAVGGARQVVAAPTGTQTFAHVASAQPFVVPAGVTEIFVDLSGAQGGNAFGSSQRGGFGAEVVARVPVTPGETSDSENHALVFDECDNEPTST